MNFLLKPLPCIALTGLTSVLLATAYSQTPPIAAPGAPATVPAPAPATTSATTPLFKPGIANVTATVAALVQKNVLSVTATPALAPQDPASGVTKRLLVTYTILNHINSQESTVAVLDNQRLNITAPPGQTLIIKQALYGNIDFPVVDVTEAIKAAVAADKVSLTVNNKTLTGGADPARRQVKQLRVNYLVGGQAHSLMVEENQPLTLPAPADGTGTLVITSAQYGNLNADLPVALLDINTPIAPRQARPALQVTPVAPVKFEQRGAVAFADFGEDAYGNLQISLPPNAPAATLTVRLGEKLADDGSIDRKPPGSVNFREITLATQPGKTTYQLEIPSKPRHSNAAAVHTPPEIGEVTPFRYIEIEGAPAALSAAALRQMFVHTAFDDGASSFQSDDATLNAVWELCKHTMKATTAFGVYIDGERERIPYEGDAYINHLSYLATDPNPAVGRFTTEHLLEHPTWPTEWSLHMPMLAAADYEMTGNPVLAANNYSELRKKLLMDRAREDGLLRAGAIVDWPQAERDGYNDGKADPNNGQQVGPVINTVANAFYFNALRKMAEMARALNKTEDAQTLDAKAAQVYESFNVTFFDANTGLYLDGEGSTHSSLHANMFALAFDLVPAERVSKVADFVQSRGMACSVYGAQYLLEALYKAGRADYAQSLITAPGDRSWKHMLDSGSTMTWEAWDVKYKGNLTWNHAWGSAPANIISRYIVGVRPLTPGYGKILIAPQPGTLKSVQARVPTARGPIAVSFQNAARFALQIEVPQGTTAQVALPFRGANAQVTMDKKKVAAQQNGAALVVDNVAPGRHTFEVS